MLRIFSLIAHVGDKEKKEESMPNEYLNGIWRKTEDHPRHVDIRVIWPDDESWKEDPLSKVFVVETRDADTENAEWEEIGCFATKSEGQKCADDYLGASHAGDWQAEA